MEETVSSTRAGSVRSRLVADLSVEAAGSIAQIHARKGARVKKGDPLISLDRRDAEAALVAARKELGVLEANLNEARARWTMAVRDRDRYQELLGTGAVTQAQLDQAQMQVDVTAAACAAAEARVEAQKAAVARAQIAVDKCLYTAPFDGVVAELFVEVGEWALPGKTVVRLLDPEHLYVRAELDEVDMAEIREGLPVRVTLDPYKGRRFEGTITRVAPYVNEAKEQNRTVEIEVELSAQINGLALKHGTSADVEVILRTAPDVLRIPTLALMEGQRVLVVGPDGRAQARKLRIGLKNWEYAEVQEGLKPGDMVIVSLESEKVKEGVEVRVVQESER